MYSQATQIVSSTCGRVRLRARRTRLRQTSSPRPTRWYTPAKQFVVSAIDLLAGSFTKMNLTSSAEDLLMRVSFPILNSTSNLTTSLSQIESSYLNSWRQALWSRIFSLTRRCKTAATGAAPQTLKITQTTLPSSPTCPSPKSRRTSKHLTSVWTSSWTPRPRDVRVPMAL